MLKNAIQKKEEIDTYYHYLCYTNKSHPKEQMKEFMLSLLEDYSKQNEININSAGTISKDILSRIKQNIHVHITTFHFMKDNFDIINNTNIKEISIKLPILNKECVDMLFKKIINVKISALNIDIFYKHEASIGELFVTSLINSNLNLTSFHFRRNAIRIKDVNSNLNCIEAEKSNEHFYDEYPQYEEHIKSKQLLYDFIKSQVNLQNLYLKAYERVDISDGNVKKTFQALTKLERINIEHYYKTDFSNLIKSLNKDIKEIKFDCNGYINQLYPIIFKRFTNLKFLWLNSYTIDKGKYSENLTGVPFTEYIDQNEQADRIETLKRNKNIRKIIYTSKWKKYKNKVRKKHLA